MEDTPDIFLDFLDTSRSNLSIIPYKTMKSIFASKTFWSIVLGVIAGITPTLVEAAERGQITPSDIGSMVLIVCTGGFAITGRVQATERIYTPDYLPGPNKSDEIN